MQNLIKIIKSLVPFGVAIVIVGFCYVAVQQNFRMSANDPQIALAEDAAIRLGVGANPKDVLPPNNFVFGQSLSPFMIIFDDTGKLLTSSGPLTGTEPFLPTGVFEYAKIYGENRFTWQPESNIRQAAVLVYYDYTGKKPGFVLVSRSLKETENRIDNLGKMALLVLSALFILNILALAI